jgi:hypothetical protein
MHWAIINSPFVICLKIGLINMHKCVFRVEYDQIMTKQFIYFLFLMKKIHKWSKINCPPKFNMVISSMGTSHVCNEIGAIGLLRIIPFNECNELFNLIFDIWKFSFDKISDLQCQGSYKSVMYFSLKKIYLHFCKIPKLENVHYVSIGLG